MAEEADPISAPMSGAKDQTMTAQLLARLGIKPTAREDFLASAITALGVTPEAVSAALDSGKSGFVADHIKAAIDTVKAEADKLRPEASLLAEVRASLGVPATADKAAILAAVEAKASAQAAGILAQRGVPAAKTSGIPAGSAPGATMSAHDRLKAAFAARRNLTHNN